MAAVQESQQPQKFSKRRSKPLVAAASQCRVRRQPSQNDIRMLLVSGALIGAQRVSNHMTDYMFPHDSMVQLLKEQYEKEKSRQNRLLQQGKRAQKLAPPQFSTLESTFDLRCVWNQLNLAAMLLAGVTNPANILVVASNPRAANGASSLAKVLGANACIGRYVPGTLTNTNQVTYCEPPFMILASATEDTQAIKESSNANTAIIAFADSTSNLEHVDIPIPCNTKGTLSIGAMMYFLARQYLRHRGELSYDSEIPNLLPDHFVQQKMNKKSEDDVINDQTQSNAAAGGASGTNQQQANTNAASSSGDNFGNQSDNVGGQRSAANRNNNFGGDASNPDPMFNTAYDASISNSQNNFQAAANDGQLDANAADWE